LNLAISRLSPVSLSGQAIWTKIKGLTAKAKPFENYAKQLARRLFELIALDKAINSPFGIDNLLLPGIERVAVAADFNPNLVLG